MSELSAKERITDSIAGIRDAVERAKDDWGDDLYMQEPTIQPMAWEAADLLAAYDAQAAEIARLRERLEKAEALIDVLADANVVSSRIWYGPVKVRDTDEYIKFRATATDEEAGG